MEEIEGECPLGSQCERVATDNVPMFVSWSFRP